MEEKEKEILESCTALMFRYGIRSLTMDDIAQNLGISKKTLYQYFENKADLVEKLLGSAIERQKLCLDYAAREMMNPIEEMASIYRHNSMMFKQMNPSLTFELKKYYPKAWQILDSFKNDFILQSVIHNLERGVKSGLYRNDFNIAIIARLYASRITDLISGEVFPSAEFSHLEVLREMFYYHIRGIASEKGITYLEKEVKLDI